MKRAKNATLVFCLFVVYCVLLSQGLKASAVSAFFGALAAVPLTVHLYRRLWPLPPEKDTGNVARASASGEMLVKQNRNASRAELMDASGLPTRSSYPHAAPRSR